MGDLIDVFFLDYFKCIFYNVVHDESFACNFTHVAWVLKNECKLFNIKRIGKLK